MKNSLIVLIVVCLLLLLGCNGPVSKSSGELLTVDFHEGEVLRYKFISKRDITLDWGSSKSSGKRPDKSSESLEMVMAYEPIEIDTFEGTTVKATCESIKAVGGGSRSSGGEAILVMRGKSFTFKVGPTGRIEDNFELVELLKQAGNKAMRSSSSQGTIKDPDLIDDFMATQCFLWNSIASIENPVEGVVAGDTWHSIMSVPTPLVLRLARNVDYTFDEIREDEGGRLGVIKSSYSYAPSAAKRWPVPYTQKFQISGKFGTLRGYKVVELSGEGEELYNIDKGRSEGYSQKLTFKTSAMFLMPLPGLNPTVTINQNITMELLEQ